MQEEPDPLGAARRERLLAQLRQVIADDRVLAAVAAVPRELFVPEELRRYAWENCPLPIGEGQTISQPLVVARMCELLALRGGERVLDVGTGSGYHAAVLAALAAEVVSVERHAGLSRQAGRALERAGVTNIRLVVGDGSAGVAEGTFDAINVAAASHAGVPHGLAAQLADGGRLVVPVDGDEQRLLLVTRRGDRLEQRDAGRVRFVPLVPRS